MSYAQLAASVENLVASNTELADQARQAIAETNAAKDAAESAAQEAQNSLGHTKAVFQQKSQANAWAAGLPSGRYVTVLSDETLSGCQALYVTTGPESALSLVRVEYSPKQGRSISLFGAALDGVTNDVDAVKSAIEAGVVPIIDGPCRIAPVNAADSKIILEALNTLQLQDMVNLALPAINQILVDDALNLVNPTLGSMSISGSYSSAGSSTAVTSNGGNANNWSFTVSVASTSGISVGDYVILTPSKASYTDWDAFVAGCWAVSALSENSITFTTNNASVALPSGSVTSLGLDVGILKTVIQFPRDSAGVRLNGAILGAISNLVVAGKFDASTEEAFDGPGDGLQVGAAPDTYNTGLNESQQLHHGATWVQRVAIVGFQGNGVQTLHGSLYGSLLYVCSCSWRGVQAAGNGECLVKGVISAGNGASGSETEAGGNLNCANSWQIGNRGQGLYSIGLSQIEGDGSVVMFNLGAQLDARNGGHILGDGIKATGSAAIICNGGRILVGASAVVDGSISIDEAGVLVAKGAASVTGAISFEEGSTYLQPDGTFYRATPGNNRLAYNTSWQYRLSMSSIGDVSHQFAPAGSSTWTTMVTYKADGTGYPAGVGTQSWGRAQNPWGNLFTKQLTLQPPASATPNASGDVVFQLTNDTTLTIKVKGADGTVRSNSLTLS